MVKPAHVVMPLLALVLARESAACEPLHNSRVGEVVASVLHKDAFREVYGEEWELLEGQPVTDADLLRLLRIEQPGVTNLPDARGVFLRGKQYDKPKGGASYGDKPTGTQVSDMIGSHTHPGDKDNIIRGFWKGRPFVPGGTGGDTTTGNGVRNADMSRTGAAGGPETMPRHIVINFYVKVRVACY